MYQIKNHIGKIIDVFDTWFEALGWIRERYPDSFAVDDIGSIMDCLDQDPVKTILVWESELVYFMDKHQEKYIFSIENLAL